MHATAPTLSCNTLTVSVPGRTLVEALTLNSRAGEIIAVLGRNGAGKTLTLLTLAGLRDATGVVQLDGRPFSDWPRSDIAKRLALLPQDVDDIFPASVLDTALIGRHPHVARWQWESSDDRAIALAALERMQLAELAARDVLTLSGGERRRLAIAQILTQQPGLYLLDEPTNHLDPQHQLDTMRLFRHAADAGASVIATLHDVNLAARFADRCLLLHGDGRWDLGPSGEILNVDSLSDLFATPIEAVPWREQSLFVAAGERS